MTCDLDIYSTIVLSISIHFRIGFMHRDCVFDLESDYVTSLDVCCANSYKHMPSLNWTLHYILSLIKHEWARETERVKYQ